MKALKKKIAFVLVVATIALCLAVTALADGKQVLLANSTWESSKTGVVAYVMADGQCYVSIVFGGNSDYSYNGVATVVYFISTQRYIYALTSQYSAAAYWETYN